MQLLLILTRNYCCVEEKKFLIDNDWFKYVEQEACVAMVGVYVFRFKQPKIAE